MTRDEPKRSGRGGLVLAWAMGLAWMMGLASGCGSATSLDRGSPDGDAPATAGTSTTDATLTAAPSSADATTATATATADAPEPVRHDVPPPGTCPSECEVELSVAWSWEDDADPPDDPLDQRLAAMTWTPDGTLLVADTRSAASWLTQLTAEGELIWSLPFDFTCDCEIVDLGFSSIDQLLVLGGGFANLGQDWFELAGYFIDRNYLDFVWREDAPLFGPPDRPARVGSLLPLASGSIVVLAIETGLDTNAQLEDRFELRYYSGAAPQDLWQLDTQLVTAPPRRPRGVVLPSDALALAIPAGAGAGDHVVRVKALYDVESESVLLPGPVDAMAAGPEGMVATVGLDRTGPGSPVLHVASLPSDPPPAWLEALEVPAPGIGAPALAVDASGSTYVALRAEPDAGNPAVMLWRWDAEGTLVWSTTLPLPASDAPIPVALSLVPADDRADEQDLVLAAIVDGRLHLERREQGCRCDL